MKYVNKDITTVEPGSIIAHGVNTCHVMGAGVAKAIAEKWPEVKERYMSLKNPHLSFIASVPVENDITIYNCYTQETYGRTGVHANASAVILALKKIAIMLAYSTSGVAEINIPKIGCGLGGLEWDDLEPRLIEIEKTYNVEFIVHSL